ncbi:MAG: MBL fold metallo-hydrolase [Candidatus Methanomethylophilaceae archaeon]|nr:MBL fold metallo-hydrolase [Candidatus Methanomethylophilaceae archaeon]MBR3477069.1 MBL fold metallo-hydrolase [Candidatus Methanomethylophilaceae archaeon]MBR4697736.1 MBL fold metallo-hydrolase [Candidatus Methanomethylophilaceae archaeon]MBR6203604.1 MBL fold metallo-hydrolase [Candidatus Methanomethylophilaceae archaeon]
MRWHGHACFEFENGEHTVVIDPHDGRSLGIKPPAASADIVLMTHEHYDHRAAWIINGNHEDVMAREGRFSVKGLEVEGFRTFHDTTGGSERGMNTVYLFEMDGLRICHCGDLGCIPGDDIISRIKGVDILMVPTGEVFTMEMRDVRRFIELVNPTITVPMHYRVGGLTLPISTIDDFLEIIPEEYVDYIGNEIDVTPDDLTEMKECWIFER